MRICLFQNLASGGAKRAIHETIRRLSERHEIDAYSLQTAYHHYCDIRPFVRRYEIIAFSPFSLFASPFGRLNQLQRWRTILALENVGRCVARAIDERNYDVVYVHPDMWTQAPTLLKFSRSRTVYHMHESLREVYEPAIPRPYDNKGIRHRIDRIDPLIPLYRKRLTRVDHENTRAARQRLANSRFTADNVRRNYECNADLACFGVDGSTFRPLVPSALATQRDFVLSVGALTPRKGFDFLVEALAIIPERLRPELRIVSNVADPRERSYLESLAADLHVDIVVETMVSEEILVERYNQALLLLYSPIREPFGLVPLEAMACGTPVVAVAEGGITETVVDKVNGLLVDRHARRFAEATRCLLEDSTLRRRYGQQARESVCDLWTWERSIDNIEKHLNTPPQ